MSDSRKQEAWKAYVARAKNFGPESAFKAGFDAATTDSAPRQIPEHARTPRGHSFSQHLSFRENLARAIFYAAPPSNPHGPDSDLDFGDNYVKWERERAYRIADGLLASGILD